MKKCLLSLSFIVLSLLSACKTSRSTSTSTRSTTTSSPSTYRSSQTTEYYRKLAEGYDEAIKTLNQLVAQHADAVKEHQALLAEARKGNIAQAELDIRLLAFNTNAGELKAQIDDILPRVLKKEMSCEEFLKQNEEKVQPPLRASLTSIVELEQATLSSLKGNVSLAEKIYPDKDAGPASVLNGVVKVFENDMGKELKGMRGLVRGLYEGFVSQATLTVCATAKSASVGWEIASKRLSATEAENRLAKLGERESTIAKEMASASAAKRRELEAEKAGLLSAKWEVIGGLQSGDIITVDRGGKASVITPDNAAKYTHLYNSSAYKSFHEIASSTSGVMGLSGRPSDLPEIVRYVMEHIKRNSVSYTPLDVAFVIDTTGSMSDDIEMVKTNLNTIIGLVTEMNRGRNNIRLGVLLYRDKGDAYVNKIALDLTSDFAAVKTAVKNISVGGGGDSPEAVLDALLKAGSDFSWNSRGQKKIILIGDAPPHENTIDGSQSTKDVTSYLRSSRLDIVVYPIITNM